MSKGNFKKLSYLLNLQILRDLKITIGSAVGIMLLNIAYFSYSLSDELKIYLEKTENIGAIQMFSPMEPFSSFVSRINGRILTLLILGCFCLYCWYLWLGEFKGENKSAYTLLTLPLPKKFIIIYKFLSACFYYFSLVFFQIVALLINYIIFNIMVPTDAIVKESLITILSSSISNFYGLIPVSFVNLITNGLFFIAMIILTFLFAILERSFGVKGGILGVILGCSFLFLVLIFPGKMDFYMFERFIWFVFISILYNLFGLFYSKYLLEKKFMCKED
ncbi:putative membrane protein [Clostridium perfringens B str. ATCC 3626]|uniref:Membrane protein n=2 Tax=Clostridium perfringens TaxID=1502 RepID=A0AAV3BXA9_CLOPF|nr:putative membrane protein [Clostridium perfringens B str. ATCC 3626]